MTRIQILWWGLMALAALVWLLGAFLWLVRRLLRRYRQGTLLDAYAKGYKHGVEDEREAMALIAGVRLRGYKTTVDEIQRVRMEVIDLDAERRRRQNPGA